MNRIEEYNEYLNELEQTPPELEFTLTRAQAKYRHRKRVRRNILFPLTSVLTCCIAFVLMVNLSTTFAMACTKIPLIKDLAAAVSFSPSLSAALENDYVQIINLEETKNDITMRIEYVIVDQAQLNIFYTLDSSIYSHMSASPEIRGQNNEALEGYAISSGDYGLKNRDIRQFTVDFVDTTMPNSLTLTCRVHDNGSFQETTIVEEKHANSAPEYTPPTSISSFTFELNFDPKFTAQGETIELKQSITMSGQSFTADTLEIYPTHIRLSLNENPDNTAWLKSIRFYVENEHGKRFEPIANGLSAIGSEDSKSMLSFMLESSFFAKSKHLTLTITGADWLDKSLEFVEVDLANKTASFLPDGASIDTITKNGSNWTLNFLGTSLVKNSSRQIFFQSYKDPKGGNHSYNGWSSGTNSHWDEEKQEYVEQPYTFNQQFTLYDYPYDKVNLSLAYSKIETFKEPVVISIK